MDKFLKLIVLTEQEQQHNLTLLAKSLGINVTQLSREEALNKSDYKHGTLLACPTLAGDISKKGISQPLQALIKKAPLFLFQVERSLLNAEQSMLLGIRGVVYRDEPIDRVATALKTMINGELYFSRNVMSQLLDMLIKQKLEKPILQDYHHLHSALTKQEKRIVGLVAKGARNYEIADNLQISEHTVKAHISAIFKKTHVRNRVELLRSLSQATV